MKNFTLMAFIICALISCGRNDDLIDPPAKKGVTVESAVNTSPACTFLDVGDDVEMTCDETVILIPGERLSSSVIASDKVTLKSSRKNDGADGDKNYDLVATLDSALTLELPSEVSATGNAGSNMKLYLKLNNDIDCAWTSDGSGKYIDPHCFTDATRDSTTASGFIGGTEEADLIIENVLDIEMTLDNSDGNGVITTASAILTIIP